MLEVQRRHTVEMTDRLNFHVEKVTEIVAGCAGTSSTEQNQKVLMASLKWEIASLQARLSKILNSDHAETVAADQFLCDVVALKPEVEELQIVSPPERVRLYGN